MTPEELKEIRERYANPSSDPWRVFETAVQDVPKLLDEIERLQKRLELAEEVCAAVKASTYCRLESCKAKTCHAMRRWEKESE